MGSLATIKPTIRKKVKMLKKMASRVVRNDHLDIELRRLYSRIQFSASLTMTVVGSIILGPRTVCN